MSDPGSPSASGKQPSIGFVVMLVALTLAAFTSLWFVMHAAWADAGSLQARTVVTGLRDGTRPSFTPELWERTRSQLQSALETAPNNAQLHDDLAFLFALRSQRMGDLPTDSAELPLQQDLMDEAIVHYREACALRPTFPYTWAHLAMAKYLRRQFDEEFLTAYDRTLQYGHSEADLHIIIAQLTYAQWQILGDQRQHAFANLVATAKESSRIMFLNLAERAGIVLPAQ